MWMKHRQYADVHRTNAISSTPRKDTGDDVTLCLSQRQIAKVLLTQALSFGISNTGLCFTVQLAITDSELFPPFSLGWR